MSKKFYLYTDGSCDNYSDGKEGGWAFVLLDEYGEIIKKSSGHTTNTTNNRMEMIAIIEGCKHIPEHSTVEVVSDSQYALYVFFDVWNPKTNFDLVKQFKDIAQNLDTVYRWVKGHSGDKFNELCDQMALKEMDIAKKELFRSNFDINTPADIIDKRFTLFQEWLKKSRGKKKIKYVSFYHYNTGIKYVKNIIPWEPPVQVISPQKLWRKGASERRRMRIIQRSVNVSDF